MARTLIRGKNALSLYSEGLGSIPGTDNLFKTKNEPDQS